MLTDSQISAIVVDAANIKNRGELYHDVEVIQDLCRYVSLLAADLVQAKAALSAAPMAVSTAKEDWTFDDIMRNEG